MKLPFTVEQFLEVFKNYNLSVWPLQIIFYLLGVAALLFSFKKFISSDKLIASILSIFWLWMGIAYHIIYFTAINKAAYIFGALFVIQGIVFLIYGVFKNKFNFQFQSDVYGLSGAIIIFFALILYPVLGSDFGHAYPYAPTLGLPCPTTIFTFGLLVWNRAKTPFAILFIPFLWSAIGFAAAFSLSIYEDTGLPISAILVLIMSIIKNKRLPEKIAAVHFPN